MAVLVLGVCGPQCGGNVDNSPCEAKVGPSELPMPDGTMRSIQFGVAVPIAIEPTRLDLFLTAGANACPAGWFLASQPASSDIHALWLDMWRPGNGSYLGTFDLDASHVYGDYPGRAAVATMDIPAGSSFDLNSVALDVVSGTLTISALDDAHVAGSIQGTFQDGTPLEVQFDVPYCTSECSAH